MTKCFDLMECSNITRCTTTGACLDHERDLITQRVNNFAAPMTTDRTALEAARDALPPLPRFPMPDRPGPDWTWNIDDATVIARAAQAYARDYARDTLLQAVAIHQDAAVAALSSPPVLPAEPVAYVIDWQDIGEGAAQSFYYGLGAKENMQAAINYAASIPRSAKVTPLTPYAAPQSAAPALDDARDAVRAERDALLAERGDPKAAWCLCVQNGDRMRRAEGRLAWLHSSAACNVDGYEWGIFRVKWENGRATEVWQTASDFSDLDAAMQQEPRS